MEGRREADTVTVAAMSGAAFLGWLGAGNQSVCEPLFRNGEGGFRIPAEERGEIFKLLFRAAHSLKGAARAVDVDLLERVCHRLEDILAASRSQSIKFTPQLFALLFKTIDGIDDAGAQLRQSKDLTSEE